jgi:hypothetical protein
MCNLILAGAGDAVNNFIFGVSKNISFKTLKNRLWKINNHGRFSVQFFGGFSDSLPYSTSQTGRNLLNYIYFLELLWKKQQKHQPSTSRS